MVERKLKGENQIVIDNLKLGGGWKARTRPACRWIFAIALLSDSKGVIDLGLPGRAR